MGLAWQIRQGALVTLMILSILDQEFVSRYTPPAFSVSERSDFVHTPKARNRQGADTGDDQPG